MIYLPEHKTEGSVSVEEALQRRRSVRGYKPEILKLETVAQLLWATNGLNCHRRTAPSAGGTHAMETYIVIGDVDGVPQGVYRHLAMEKGLSLIKEGDYRGVLAEAALSQNSIKVASVDVVLAANYEKITHRYNRRGYRYISIEAGHMGQNLALQAVALGLGTVMIGAFRDSMVKSVLGIQEDPIYIIPVGRV